MTWRPLPTARSLAVATAILGILAGIAFGFAASLVPPAVRDPAVNALAAVDPATALLSVGGLIGLYALFASRLWRAQPSSRGFADLEREAPERDVDVVGTTDARPAAERPELDPSSGFRDDPRRVDLRDLLIGVYERHEGDLGEARRRVDDGRWTDDRYAAAFLTSTDAVEYPLSHRLYAWLYPESAYEYRLERTLRVVEAVCADELSDFEPPETEPTRFDRVRRALRAVIEGRVTDA